MKSISLFFLSLFFAAEAQAVSFPRTAPPWTLVAERNRTKRYYRLGDAVSVEYKTGEDTRRIKGYMTGINEVTIEISPFQGKKTSESITINSILSITRVNRKARKTAAIITGILAVLTGALALLSKGRIFDSPWGLALVGIPLIGAAVYLFLYVGFTYLGQLLQKHSVKKGWKFFVADAPPRKRKLFNLFPNR